MTTPSPQRIDHEAPIPPALDGDGVREWEGAMKKKPVNFRPQVVNVNKHNEYGLHLLEKSIRGDGWIGAVTVAADGEAFDGSARVETLANVMPSAEPIVVETDGTRPVYIVRTDIPTADDPRAKRLGVAANSIAQVDYNPDADILAMLISQDASIAELVKGDDKATEALMKQESRLETETTTLEPKKYMRVLVSIPVEFAGDCREIVEQLAEIPGAEVDYGAN